MVEGLSEEGKKLKTGIYQHYRGLLYEVLGVGHHTETEEELVFYRSLYGKYGFWARPLKMFCGEVEIDGELRARFIYLGKPGCVELLESTRVR